MPIVDKTGDGSGDPSSSWFAITPSDSTDLAVKPRALYVGVSGDITMIGIDGVSCLFKAVPVGIWPLRPHRITVAGTAATNILGLI